MSLQVRVVKQLVSKIILYWFCFVFTKCGTQFGCILGTFSQKIYILGPFAILWGGLGGLGAKRLPKSLILGSPWGPFGVPFWWNFAICFNEKTRLVFAAVLPPKMVPNASQNEANIESKFNLFSSSFSYLFFSGVWEAFRSFSEAPHPRFDCYLQRFRRVEPLSQNPKK